MRLVSFVALLCSLAHVEGDLSELDIFNDVQPLRIGAFNIQIFGETTYLKSEVRNELIKVNRYQSFTYKMNLHIAFEFIFEPGQA